MPHAQYLEEGVLCGHLGVLCDKCLKGYYEGVQPALEYHLLAAKFLVQIALHPLT